MQWTTRMLTSSCANLINHGASFSHFKNMCYICSLYGNKLFARHEDFWLLKHFNFKPNVHVALFARLVNII